MPDTRPNTSQHSPNSGAPRPSGGRQRIISSCLTCRRRKVRCDQVHPVCGACSRGNHVCTYGSDQLLGSAMGAGGSRISKPALVGTGKISRNGDVQARLDRLEMLLEKAVAGQGPGPQPPRSVHPHDDENEHESEVSPSSSSQALQGAGMSSDNHDGTLLLDDGQSKFVSSLHYALLADEIQDIKALLGDRTDEGQEGPTPNNLIHLVSLGRARLTVSLEMLLPHSQEHRDALLDIYFTSLDPLIRITHRPTLIRKFPTYVREVHPLAFAIFYSAVNSLPPAVVETKFGESKEELMARFELGVEIGLARGNYLTSPSFELFQAFIIWLTCITREEDMGKAWALLGIAIRIGLNQGLHRDPSLFPSGSFDVVTVELRRRAWHQICTLEFRAAESKGQEPSIAEDDYTTLFPRNIEDEELVEGESPGVNTYNEERWTSMTYQLVRFTGMRVSRWIIKSTYRLERRMMESGLHGTSGPDPATELQSIYHHIKHMVEEMHEEMHRKYLRFCNPEVPVQRLTLGLANLTEWRCYVLFWLRMPRAFRDIVFSSDVRKSIFEKSVNCIEALNGATVDVDAARFQWHIGGHAAFQAIMHVLSELRNPLFDAPDHERAIRALKLSRLLKEQNHTKPWQAVKSMIDRLVGEQSASVSSQSENSVSYTTNAEACGPGLSMRSSATVYQAPQVQPQPQPPHPPPQLPSQIPAFAQPAAPQALLPQRPVREAPPPPRPAPLPLDTTTQFQWDDINFNMLIGDTFNATNLPEFDFGFWGDPINFASEPVEFPPEGGWGVEGRWEG